MLARPTVSILHEIYTTDLPATQKVGETIQVYLLIDLKEETGIKLVYFRFPFFPHKVLKDQLIIAGNRSL